jgi:hypothetical protein
VSALLPFPGAAAAAKLSGIWAGLRRVLAIVRHPLAETGSTGVGAAGGSIASVGALKVGIAVVCVAGAAGGYAVCARLGGLPPVGASLPAHARAIPPESRHRSAQETRSTPAGTGRPAAIASAATAASTTTVAPPVPHAQRRRVSAFDQVRREFGTPPAHTAAAAGAAAAASTAIRTQVASGSSASATPTPTPSPRTKQTQTEFGFER